MSAPPPPPLQPTRRGWHPSVPAIVFLFWLILVPLIFPGRLLNSDGDLARHIRHGEYILATGSVIRADPFSFTRPEAPFVGIEYGSQVVVALVHRAAGLPGILALAALIIALTHALVARLLLRRGVDASLAYLAAMAGAMVALAHWIARPHLVSVLLTVVLLGLLERPREAPARPWSFGLLFVAWANLHGGFLFGLILIGTYLAGYLLETARGVEGARQRVRRTSAVLLVSAAATLVTPYGFQVPRHLVAFFADPALRDNTSEFFSPNFHWAGMKFFLAALLGVIAALAWSRRPPALPHLLVLLETAGFALLAQRNVTLFAVTALPLLAVHLDPEWRALADPHGLRAAFARGAARAATLPWILAGGLGISALAGSGGGGRLGGWQALPDRFDARVFPVEAVARAQAAGLTGRLFNEFRYGGYVLYAWPEIKVFIDGGSDFYGGPLLQSYARVRDLAPGWRDSLATWRIDLLLFPVGWALPHQLAREPGWSVWYCDATAALLRRDSLAPPTSIEGAQTLAACARRATAP